jgi:hypothetical protein
MRLDVISRLLEGADFALFRDVAFEYLTLRGFTDVVLKDGWGDGGSDVAVGNLAGSSTSLGIQLTVQRQGWEAKLKTDALKVSSELDAKNFLYVTSRRLPTTLVTPIQDELLKDHGISLQTADSQGIASLFVERGQVTRLLELFGIPATQQSGGLSLGMSPLRLDAALAFAFFGSSTTSFKEEVVESVLLAALAREEEGLARTELVRQAKGALQLEEGQQQLVESVVDRMLQQGYLKSVGGRVSARADLADATIAAETLHRRAWKKLQEELNSELGRRGLRGRNLELASEAAQTASGALVVSSAEVARDALTSQDVGPAQARARRRLRELDAALATAGVTPEKRPDLIQALTDRVLSADISRQLLASELFLSLTSMETPQLLRALGGAGGLDVLLDASVAIPMLANLFYEAGSQRYFEAARVAHVALREHEIALVLPQDYLEEAASHLILAAEKYAPLVGKDPDLRFSTNAFVAHYVDLKERGKTRISFSKYVESFGFSSRDVDFQTKKREVMRTMEGLFLNYGITTTRLPASAELMAEAQTAIAFTAKDLGLERPGRLLRHDARTVAYLAGYASRGGRSALLCTWDRLHLRLDGPRGASRFEALDPAMVADLLALAGSDDRPLLSGAMLAIELGDQASEMGASVLDALVRIEGGNLHDAETLRRAQEFKASFLEGLRSGANPDDIGKAWAASKESEIPES